MSHVYLQEFLFADNIVSLKLTFVDLRYDISLNQISVDSCVSCDLCVAMLRLHFFGLQCAAKRKAFII